MKSVAARNKKAAEKAKMMELLDSAQPGEVSATVTKTYSQRDITKHADVQTLNKKFDLHLEMGKYHRFTVKNLDYSELRTPNISRVHCRV